MRALRPTSLRRAAEHHVSRHPCTAKRLGEVLRRKVEAHAKKHDVPIPEEAPAWITEIVEAFERTGLVDDRRLAEARTRTLRARGKSTRAVQVSLRQKGVPAELVESVTSRDGYGEPTSREALDTDAAWNLARRKKLGPYRDSADRAAFRQKDLAALARAGFSFSLARAVVEAPEAR